MWSKLHKILDACVIIHMYVLFNTQTCIQDKDDDDY